MDDPIIISRACPMTCPGIGCSQKHKANLKSDDPVIARRVAVGYYCVIEGRHFIVLEDAELDYYSTYSSTGAVNGMVEIMEHTVECIEREK